MKKPPLTEGLKYDEGKPRYDLLPPAALNQVARVYAYGAAKYADRNWELGMDYGRLFAAAQRHMQDFWAGNDLDPDGTGLHNLAQATFCLLSLLEYRLTQTGNDTRTKMYVRVLEPAQKRLGRPPKALALK